MTGGQKASLARAAVLAIRGESGSELDSPVPTAQGERRYRNFCTTGLAHQPTRAAGRDERISSTAKAIRGVIKL
jgi:hypothetical protein